MLAISIDSPFTHKVWQEGELSKIIPGGLPYPMLSDAGGRIGEAYGVYDEDNGVDIRGRFLIDPDGILQAMEVLAPAVGRNVAEMIRQIRACQYVRENGRSHPGRLGAGQKTPETRRGTGGQGLRDLGPGHGLLKPGRVRPRRCASSRDCALKKGGHAGPPLQKIAVRWRIGIRGAIRQAEPPIGRHRHATALVYLACDGPGSYFHRRVRLRRTTHADNIQRFSGRR